jgi:tRNA nucleotidyltransferase/poly(A) polymerase
MQEGDVMVQLTNNLRKLSKIIKPLYIVGGYIRNALFGIQSNSIDLCGPALLCEVKELLKGSEFEIVVVSEKMGTAQIKAGGEVYDYSVFRKEKYDHKKPGKHTPSSVTFITDLKEDASRRDFTINAIYYDMGNFGYVDPFNGRQDIDTKTLRMVNDDTLKCDGVRLYRLLRFMKEYELKVDPHTFNLAIKYSSNSLDVSDVRRNMELGRIEQMQCSEMFNEYLNKISNAIFPGKK